MHNLRKQKNIKSGIGRNLSQSIKPFGVTKLLKCKNVKARSLIKFDLVYILPNNLVFLLGFNGFFRIDVFTIRPGILLVMYADECFDGCALSANSLGVSWKTMVLAEGDT